MTDYILTYEATLRLSIFIGILAVMVLWEVLAPCRNNQFSRWQRWPSNFGIVVVNTLLVRLIFPTAAVGLAVVAEERGWGIFNLIDLPVWAEILIAVIVLDLIIYLQHVMVHAVPVLWRLHRMHHADLDYDVTTGARFHPLEIILSMIIKFAAVVLLGAPAVAVIIFEVLLNATAMFNHGNIKLPIALDRVLRLFVVTPDMHRVHHSTLPEETNSNFGFSIPWWDRLLGTYRAQPKAGHQDMIIGIKQFREAKYLRLDWLMIQPFLGGIGNYSVSGRTEESED
ncbi:MAG: sterol desaturase family protein [Rhodospirillaceae bacterium]|jgi:sterol desaturase/sphingolipid hydroxylase (fatty acid hydroxylase superfamily)|nr:sterol desaturase family protein [Rhodospirillaceae bacterium]MBT4589709.1 sterol desaturase family protein [Rhodospirillaceae bacterium]MBT7267068.1 sterol desaturase family protein [Rhodospirillaceae bacterium]